MSRIAVLARALLSTVAPITGTRATTTLTVVATTPGATLRRNEYLYPVVSGAIREHEPWKVAANPATLLDDGTGGDWTIAGSPGTEVELVANVGGAQHNVLPGTVFRWADGTPTGLSATATATAIDGGSGGTEGAVKQVRFYEHFSDATQQRDYLGAKLGLFPALLLVWLSSEPADGIGTGLAQGRTRAGRKRRIFRESFLLFVISSRNRSDTPP